MKIPFIFVYSLISLPVVSSLPIVNESGSKTSLTNTKEEDTKHAEVGKTGYCQQTIPLLSRQTDFRITDQTNFSQARHPNDRRRSDSSPREIEEAQC